VLLLLCRRGFLFRGWFLRPMLLMLAVIDLGRRFAWRRSKGKGDHGREADQSNARHMSSYP
jgi:hypothetical protein